MHELDCFSIIRYKGEHLVETFLRRKEKRRKKKRKEGNTWRIIDVGMHTWPRAQEISLLMILESPCCESSLFRSYRMHAAPIFQLLFIYPQTYGRNPRIDAIFWKTIAQGRASHRCSPLHGYAIDHTFYPFQFLANEISDKREFQYIVKFFIYKFYSRA